MNDIIANSLNINPLVKQSEVIDIEPQTKVAQDFEYARGNLIAAIEKGQEALTDVVQVASMTQSSRSFEAVASILNAVTSANEKLLDLSKKKRDIEAEDGPSTINNNLFVGSTAELLKLIKTNNEKE